MPRISLNEITYFYRGAVKVTNGDTIIQVSLDKRTEAKRDAMFRRLQRHLLTVAKRHNNNTDYIRIYEADTNKLVSWYDGQLWRTDEPTKTTNLGCNLFVLYEAKAAVIRVQNKMKETRTIGNAPQVTANPETLDELIKFAEEQLQDELPYVRRIQIYRPGIKTPIGYLRPSNGKLVATITSML